MPALLIRAVWGWRGATVVRAACGSAVGVASMRVNANNPIVSTMSSDFVTAARGALGWEGQLWNRSVVVPVTTLDTLIAGHGVPRFVVLDTGPADESRLKARAEERRAYQSIIARQQALASSLVTAGDGNPESELRLAWDQRDIDTVRAELARLRQEASETDAGRLTAHQEAHAATETVMRMHNESGFNTSLVERESATVDLHQIVELY
jgi:hypothetical protein